MKKSIIAILLVLPFFMAAQQPADTIQQEEETHMAFAELLGYNTNILGLGKKAKVEVEFGDESWGWRGNDGRNFLVDENGKDIKFNSMVDAMNYMGEHGWKFEAAYVVTVGGQNVIHWLMSKEVRKGENARDGIQQRRDKKKKKDSTPVEDKYENIY